MSFEDEEYEDGVRTGQRGGPLEDFSRGLFGGSAAYIKGYDYGADHRRDSSGERYHTWSGDGKNDPKSDSGSSWSFFGSGNNSSSSDDKSSEESRSSESSSSSGGSSESYSSSGSGGGYSGGGGGGGGGSSSGGGCGCLIITALIGLAAIGGIRSCIKNLSYDNNYPKVYAESSTHISPPYIPPPYITPPKTIEQIMFEVKQINKNVKEAWQIEQQTEKLKEEYEKQNKYQYILHQARQRALEKSNALIDKRGLERKLTTKEDKDLKPIIIQPEDYFKTKDKDLKPVIIEPENGDLL